jgi:hypothetical protein
MVHNMCGASMASLCASQPNGDRTSAVEGLVDGRPSGPSRLAVRRGAGVSAGRVADGAGGRNGQTRKKPYRLQTVQARSCNYGIATHPLYSTSPDLAFQYPSP